MYDRTNDISKSRLIFFVLWIFSSIEKNVIISAAKAKAKAKVDVDKNASPASREPPFRHRNLDYWDASTLAAYLSVSPTKPHNIISMDVYNDIKLDNDEDSNSNSNSNSSRKKAATKHSNTPVYSGNDAAILFYAQWCQNCHSLAPMWDQIAEIIHAGTTKSNVIMALFDCEKSDQHKSLCSAVGITHYPTLMFVGKGKFHDTDPVTSTLMGKERSAGHMGHSLLPNTVKFQGDWRYGEQIIDWITIMKGLSSWNQWMERNGKNDNDGSFVGKMLKWLIRPFSPFKGSASSTKSIGEKDDQMPVGIPPEIKMKQALAESQSTTNVGTGKPVDSASLIQSIAENKKLEKEKQELQNTKDLYEKSSTHGSLLIDLLLFTPDMNETSSETTTADDEKKTKDEGITTLKPGEDIFKVLTGTWDDYSKMAQLLLDSEIEDKTIPLLQSCAVDMAIDYCTRFLTRKANEVANVKVENMEQFMSELYEKEEPYCSIIENCLTSDFKLEGCVVDSCPFVNSMGCRYVSTCLDPELKEEYMKATLELFAEHNMDLDEDNTSNGGWGIST